MVMVTMLAFSRENPDAIQKWAFVILPLCTFGLSD